ncbi:MAG TPA: hypothetical protein PKM44_09095 [Turneriella sp.]|nr:hypothetical protein [Turneriella sp.]HNJ65445.1 hypothetical protein [Turneriella sp.]HNL10654.1 hypothetical protein [Turneriella sp.]HNL53401.1 hypothetical protein [Turneriella sp.]HNN01027.1 hypothetical protein [Turneriella sp.]
MSPLARYSLYFACYVASGLAVLTTHYYQTSDYSQQSLDEQITLVAASHFSLSQLVDNLPAVFRENPHAAALKISDLRGDFLGAMYDSRRMTAAEYKQFLALKTFTPGAAAVEGFTSHIWESKRRKLRIVALSLPRMQFSEYLARMSHAAYLHYIIPLFLLAGALGIYALHMFSGKALRAVKPLPRPPQSSPVRPVLTAAPVTRTRAHAWHLKPGVVADSAIRDALQALRQMTGATCVSLFARSGKKKNSAWTGVTELRGSIIVRGDSMDATGIDRTETTATVSSLNDSKTWCFFDGEYAEASLCFCLQFDRADQAPGDELRQRIVDFTRARARSLIAEHYYENSILDADTGLYSQPYATFSLKERLLTGRPFATAILRLASQSAGIDARSARTAIRVLREHFGAETAPVIARADESTLVIIFAPETGNAGAAATALRQLFSAYRSQAKNPVAAIVEDSPSCGSAQRVLKTLEMLLAQSEKSGEVAALRQQERLHIL